MDRRYSRILVSFAVFITLGLVVGLYAAEHHGERVLGSDSGPTARSGMSGTEAGHGSHDAMQPHPESDTSDVPPDEICGLYVQGSVPQHLYAERDTESSRIIGVASGIYLEVIGHSPGGWYLVRANGPEGDGSNEGGAVGWYTALDEENLYGSCEEVPLIDKIGE